MKNIIEHINYFSFLCLLTSLTLPLPFVRFFWIVWLVSWLLECRFLKKPDIRRRSLLPMAGLAVWFVWNLLSVAWASDKTQAWLMIGRQVDILFTAPLLIFGVNSLYKRQTWLRVLVYAAAISVVIYLFNRYWIGNYEHAINKFRDSNFEINWLWMDDMLLEIKHHTLYSVVLSGSIFGVLLLSSDYEQRYGKPVAVILSTALIAWLSAGIYWSGSRTGILMVAITLSLYLLYRLKGKQRWIAVAAVLLFFVAVTLSVRWFHPRLKIFNNEELFMYKAEQTYHPANEGRVAIWHLIMEERNEYPFYGLGAGNSSVFLKEHYVQRNWQEYIEHGFNAHNQFLATGMELGAVAAILLLLLWLLIPFCYNGEKRLAASVFTIITLLVMSVENLLCGLEGIILVALSLLLIDLPAEQETSKKA